MLSQVELVLERMREQMEAGKKASAVLTRTLAFNSDGLLEVAKATLAEHESHFERYKDDKDGCATCYALNQLGAA